MKRFNVRVFKTIVVFVVLLACTQFTLKQLFKRFSTRSFVKLWVNPRFESPSDNVRDYVLNFTRQIKPPLQCVPFITLRGKIPICVHDRPKEIITRVIRSTGIWERGHCESIQNILVANPDYAVVDIGANLGMFSLLAANLQIPALAVEAMDINIEKFHQSIVINRFEKYITLVTRPLSDKHETLRLSAGMGNLGLSHIVKGSYKQKISSSNIYYEKSKMTLLLDDLIDLMPRKKAIMVIDVEGNEGKIIRGGQKFFDAVHISHVFMEWLHLSHVDRKFLVEFFIKRGYKPYKGPSFKSNLNWSAFAHWPPNVFWRKE